MSTVCRDLPDVYSLSLSSQIIVSIVQHYVDKVSVTIPEYLGELDIVSFEDDNVVVVVVYSCLSCLFVCLLQMCMLLNNLQALRSNIHSLFDDMGGNEVSLFM